MSDCNIGPAASSTNRTEIHVQMDREVAIIIDTGAVSVGAGANIKKKVRTLTLIDQRPIATWSYVGTSPDAEKVINIRAVVGPNSQLYFVAADIGKLTHGQKSDDCFYKSVWKLPFETKGRMPIICERSNGTIKSYYLIVLTEGGVKKLLDSSGYPFAEALNFWNWISQKIDELRPNMPNITVPEPPTNYSTTRISPKPTRFLTHLSPQPTVIWSVPIQDLRQVQTNENNLSTGSAIVDPDVTVTTICSESAPHSDRVIHLRVMGGPTKSELLFVAGDIGQLIFERKQSHNFATKNVPVEEKAQMKIKCERSNGTTVLNISNVLTLDGVKRLLNSSRSPLAKSFLTWICNQVDEFCSKGPKSMASTSVPATTLTSATEFSERNLDPAINIPAQALIPAAPTDSPLQQLQEAQYAQEKTQQIPAADGPGSGFVNGDSGSSSSVVRSSGNCEVVGDIAVSARLTSANFLVDPTYKSDGPKLQDIDDINVAAVSGGNNGVSSFVSTSVTLNEEPSLIAATNQLKDKHRVLKESSMLAAVELLHLREGTARKQNETGENQAIHGEKSKEKRGKDRGCEGDTLAPMTTQMISIPPRNCNKKRYYRSLIEEYPASKRQTVPASFFASPPSDPEETPMENGNMALLLDQGIIRRGNKMDTSNEFVCSFCFDCFPTLPSLHSHWISAHGKNDVALGVNISSLH